MFKIWVVFILFVAINVSAQGLLDEELTDPTRPAHNAVPQTNHNESHQTGQVFKVSQIYISKKKKLAIINGKKVKMGDQVDGAEVLAIKSGGVSLLVDGSITVITIMPSIKQYKK